MPVTTHLVYALTLAVFAASPPPVTGEAAAPPLTLPLTYIQSGFTTDDPPAWFYKTYDRKRLRVEGIAQFFDGAEVLNLNVDTATGRRDVRDLARAMRAVSAEQGRLFPGFWSFPRLPGFFRPEEVAKQPESYRAYSLKADRSVWRRAPSLPEDNESKIKFTGELFDVANGAAVEELLASIRRVFAWDGPEDECVGALCGFIVLNECMLSSNWESVWSKQETEHDVASPDTVMRLGRKTHRELFVDADPRYSYLNPAKRCVPLFSPTARDSFVAFARERGHNFDKLPADRNEFNDDAATVSLPDWVEFVDPADTNYWRVWEDWVYETWTTFIERVARAWCLAQKGNPYFRGVLYFQLPMWYSLREASKEPVAFQYRDERGDLQTETVTMADYEEYDVLNSVAMGTDMERLMRSPWFAGMVHETTKSIHVRPPGNLSLDEYDEAVENHQRFRHYFLAQGALAKRVCHANGKLFGAFARSQYFRGSKHLTPESFVRAFDRAIVPLQPDVVATIGPWFAEQSSLDPKYRPVMLGTTGPLESVWQAKREEYRRGFPTKQ